MDVAAERRAQRSSEKSLQIHAHTKDKPPVFFFFGVFLSFFIVYIADTKKTKKNTRNNCGSRLAAVSQIWLLPFLPLRLYFVINRSSWLWVRKILCVRRRVGLISSAIGAWEGGGFSPPSELLPAAAVDGAGNSMPKMRCLRPPDSCYRHTLQYPQHNMIIFKSNSTHPIGWNL